MRGNAVISALLVVMKFGVVFRQTTLLTCYRCFIHGWRWRSRPIILGAGTMNRHRKFEVTRGLPHQADDCWSLGVSVVADVKQTTLSVIVATTSSSSGSRRTSSSGDVCWPVTRRLPHQANDFLAHGIPVVADVKQTTLSVMVTTTSSSSGSSSDDVYWSSPLVRK